MRKRGEWRYKKGSTVFSFFKEINFGFLIEIYEIQTALKEYLKN